MAIHERVSTTSRRYRATSGRGHAGAGCCWSGARRDARRLMRSLGEEPWSGLPIVGFVDAGSSADRRACGLEAGIWPSIPRPTRSLCWAASIVSTSWSTAPEPRMSSWPSRGKRRARRGPRSLNLSIPTSLCIGSWSIPAGSTWAPLARMQSGSTDMVAAFAGEAEPAQLESSRGGC